MTITNEKVVSLVYELRLDSDQGEVVESISQDNPLTFLYGSGNLLPKFEENIDGLRVGDSFSFNLSSNDAYGEINEQAIVDVPIAAFEVNGSIDDSLLKIGNTIPMRDNAGNRLNGIVKEITNENVTMDFNHPLAGNHLYFSGEVTEIRDATQEELSHGHVGGCGCGGGGCDDGHHHGSGGCGDGSCGC